MYICLDCGHIFGEGEESNWSESRGEFWGVSCSEDVSGCPLCHGDYEKAVMCEKCGAYHLEEDINGGICDNCLDEYKYNIDVCYKIGDEDKEEIKINCFLTSMFDEQEIEAILYKHLKEAKETGADVDCSAFIDNDRSWFAEKLLEKGEEI